MRPEMDNHWALRDFASRLLAQICNNFNTSTNNVQSRITRLFSRALEGNKAPLASLYGALQGLSELGSEVVKVIIFPRLKTIGDRVESCCEGSNADKIAGDHIRQLVVVCFYLIWERCLQICFFLVGDAFQSLTSAVINLGTYSLPLFLHRVPKNRQKM